MRLHNKFRKLLQKKETRKQQQRATSNFKKNPYEYSKRLLNPGGKQEITFSDKEAYKYFSTIYKDNERNRQFQPTPKMTEPDTPTHEIGTKPPTWREIYPIVKKNEKQIITGTEWNSILGIQEVPTNSGPRDQNYD